MNERKKKLKEIHKLIEEHKKIGDKVFNHNSHDQNAYSKGYADGFHAGFFYTDKTLDNG
tara:strand:- start:49 stop:225 length:177 start_codon:yes stop_codon:yes gene_type:complete